MVFTRRWFCRVIFILCAWPVQLLAMCVTVTVHSARDHPKAIGSIKFCDMHSGLLIQPELSGLSPGLHGFHLHSKPSCDNHAMGAGPHLDPKSSHKHLGPYAEGHLGDLPALYVNKRGIAKHPVLAPRLKVKDLFEHAIVIHAQADNYSDTPKPLGGGGQRVACGVIQKLTAHTKF